VRACRAARLRRSAAPRVRTESDLRGFLDELEAQGLMVYEAQALEGYYQWRGDSPDFVTPFARFGNDLHNRRDYSDIIEAWRGKVADTTLARRLDVQHKLFLQSRADPADVLALSDTTNALQDSVNAFRFHVGGGIKTLTGLSEILATEADRAKRREAFLAMPQAGEAHSTAIVKCMRLLDRMQLLLWLRRSICCNAYFELTAYGNLGANLDSLYAATYRRFVCVDLPPGRYFGYRDMFGTGPLYFQSYLYANMIATQSRDAMRAKFGASDLTREKRVAGWLTAYYFAPGGSVPWPEKMRRATGQPLGTESLARYLSGAMPESTTPAGSGATKR
jgi:hypothetical protein